MRVSIVAALMLLSSPAVADDISQLKHLLQPKFQVAEVIEAAGVVGEKCPGIHVIEENIEAEFAAAGGSEDDIYSPEFRLMSERGKANAMTGFAKDPPHWCESMWKFLGPAHPPMIKHTLLKRD